MSAPTTPGSSASIWTTQQLVAFLTQVSGCPDEASAHRAAAESAAIAAEAEVGAVVVDGRVGASIGYQPHDVPTDELVAAARGRRATVPVPGVGETPVVVVAVERVPDAYLLLARRGGDYQPGERGMLRAMATVLGLTLHLLRTLSAERAARSGQETKTRQVSQLLAHARLQRQVTLERISSIQRAIASRRDLAEVLDAVTGAARELCESDIAVLQVTTEAGGLTSLAGLRAADPDTTGPSTLSQRCAREGGAVIENDVRPEHDALLAREGATAALVVPVHQGDAPVGTLTLATRALRRPYSQADAVLATTLAEHAGLALQDASTVEQLRASLSDATYQARHDSLTGLPNRSTFLGALAEALANPGAGVGALFVDLDYFKSVNDTFGHNAGDELLLIVAQRLSRHTRPGDLVARMGGDEFAVIVRDVRTDAELRAVADAMFTGLVGTVDLGGASFRISASVGVAAGRAHDTPSTLLARADLALYESKRLGRGQVSQYSQTLDTTSATADGDSLRAALAEGRIDVLYQPILTVDTEQVVGVEAQARWHEPKRGTVPAAHLLRVAEQSGLVVPLGRAVLEHACRTARRLRDRVGRPLTVNVAISTAQLVDETFVACVRDALRGSGLPAGAVVLELPPAAVTPEDPAMEAAVERLRALGVRFALDGSVADVPGYLQRLPVDYLTVDSSLVDALDAAGAAQERAPRADDPVGVPQLRTVLGLGRRLGLGVTAQGVDTDDQLAALRALGCTAARGLSLARPMPEPELAAWLEAGAAVPGPRGGTSLDAVH